MTVRLADDEISDLEGEGKIVRCIAVVCRVCEFRQHAKPGGFLPDHERCPNGCALSIVEGQCRLCGNPVQSNYAVCMTHVGRNYHAFSDGCFVTSIAETHWHAAEGAGPVSQYAVVI